MPAKSKLIPISYYNATQQVRLTAYADTLAYEQDGSHNVIRAIRFGGYPEMVRALSDAIYAGATIDADLGTCILPLISQTKRYQRQFSHDGVYAESTLLSMDDDQDVLDRQDEDQEKTIRPPRKCIIFCPANDRDSLFEEVNNKTAVPLIPEYRDYVLDELEDRRILKKLTVISLREKLDVWLMKCENDDANIVSVVEDGLLSGAIEIPGADKSIDRFSEIGSVVDYLNAFGITVAERIRSQFQPLFDPATDPLSPEILAVNDYIHQHAGYSLYDAQLAVAESVKRQLQKHKCGFIVAECGSGKTKIGATAMAAVYALRANQKKRGFGKTFNVILCPSHVAKKWTREIAETLPDTVGVVVHNIKELQRLYTLYEKGDKSIYAVISKESARDGYMKQPAVIWNERKYAFLCPDCMSVLQAPVSDDGSRYMDNADQHWFRTEHSKNRKCPNCGSPLWTAVNPSSVHRSEWVKIGGYGWVYRHRAHEHFSKVKNEAILERLKQIANDPNGYFPVVGACRRYPLSTYIRRTFKGRLDGAVVDELHQYNNNSGQGDAMGEVFNTARKIIGMTATLINGYSSGIFHLLYRVVPQLMVADGKPHGDPGKFISEYGVVENTYEEEDGSYASNRRTHRRKKRTRQLPGVSPLVYSRFLLEHAAFLTLADMGKDLPDYEELPIPLDMPKGVAAEYKRIEEILKRVMKTDRKISQKIQSAYLNLLTVYPDQPYAQPAIMHPLDPEIDIVTPHDYGSFEMLGPKERAVLDLVREKVDKGEKVLLYTSWTRTDSQEKLQKLLTQNGYRTEIMTGKIKTEKREEWVQKRLSAGMQVMITNPSLVETGLDLNAFTTLIFYSMGYNLFTLRQASRRSWRINQTAPRVEVYLLYYKDTMQHKAMRLMASKLAVAGIIEGNVSDEGLAAMSNVQDITSLMAKELMLGIKDSVEDVAAAFKRMAIINPNRKQDQQAVKTPAPAPTMPQPVPQPLPASRRAAPTPGQIAALEALEQERKAKRAKKPKTDENQLSIFDDVA